MVAGACLATHDARSESHEASVQRYHALPVSHINHMHAAPCCSKGKAAMSRYRVCFEGKWQESFRDLRDALDWGRAVGDTGRIVHVVKSRVLLNLKLIAVFPEAQADEARRLWDVRMAGQRAASNAALLGPGI